MKRGYYMLFGELGHRRDVVAENAVDAVEQLCREQSESSPQSGWQVFVASTQERVMVRWDYNTKRGVLVPQA